MEALDSLSLKNDQPLPRESAKPEQELDQRFTSSIFDYADCQKVDVIQD